MYIREKTNFLNKCLIEKHNYKMHLIEKNMTKFLSTYSVSN